MIVSLKFGATGDELERINSKNNLQNESPIFSQIKKLDAGHNLHAYYYYLLCSMIANIPTYFLAFSVPAAAIFLANE